MPRVIAENEWLLAVDKPAGLIVHSDGRTEEPTLADWLITMFPYLKNIGAPWVSPQSVAYPIGGTVHRLDRTTTGVMLVAKTSDAYAYLKGEFKARRVEKLYRAYVNGAVEGNGKIVAAIERTNVAPKRWYASPCDESDVRAAITEWRSLAIVRDARGDASYLEVKPLTGRTHQIRVHFASIGHSLLGDDMYGGENGQFSFERPALHAFRISVMLPSGEQVSYEASEPADFVAVSEGSVPRATS